MTRLGRFAVIVAWPSAAFVVQAAFAATTLIGVTPWVAVSYVLALAATFALHARTTGRALLAFSFGLCAALCAEGLYFALVNEDASPWRRTLVAVALALPVLCLVLRRWSSDDQDGWFRAHAARVTPIALAFAVSALVAGTTGARGADPAPYERAAAALGYEPLGALGDQFGATLGAMLDGLNDAARDGGLPALVGAVVPEAVEARAEPELRRRERSRTAASQERLTLFLSPWSKVDPAIQAEVRRACGRTAGSDPERACACAYDLLVSRAGERRKRREEFRTLGLASALPWAIAALFAWRGRRGRSAVHALPTV